MGLAKATLQKLSSVVKNQKPGEEIPVQFNPTSLRISTTNQTESGQAVGTRKRQYLASGSAKLTMQLVFDTADEANNGDPVSVRGKTVLVTQFLEPEKQGKKQAPPAVRFHWGEFIFEGIMDSATEEIDLFASNGTPLRAKVDITITGQRIQDLKLATGPGASDKGEAPTPESGSNSGPGTSGGDTDQTAVANAGESAAAFAARMGLDPAAWRNIADQVDDVLSLPAGQPINFSASAGTGSGLGSATGFQSGTAATAETAVDLARNVAAASTGRTEETRQAGFALAAAGGVAAAVQTAQAARADSAASASKRQFEPDAAAGGPAPAPAARAASTAGAGVVSTPAAARITDQRQQAFGYGVPLRARIAPAAAERAAVVFGSRAVTRRTPSPDPPTTDDPTVAPWTSLPVSPSMGRVESRTGGEHGTCGCRGRCGHGKGAWR